MPLVSIGFSDHGDADHEPHAAGRWLCRWQRTKMWARGLVVIAQAGWFVLEHLGYYFAYFAKIPPPGRSRRCRATALRCGTLEATGMRGDMRFALHAAAGR